MVALPVNAPLDAKLPPESIEPAAAGTTDQTPPATPPTCV